MVERYGYAINKAMFPAISRLRHLDAFEKQFSCYL